ncbi:MAG: hypothetical protein PHY09_02165 [Desulfuromonadaceae bacterium]|nr:hypothetical protein [Desulfuromonadaceae bacterium]MDD5105595.1 hypothetical protein [Desulfuromonadaceae bacterium]
MIYELYTPKKEEARIESQTFEELEKKLLDQHHEQYLAFTRLILTLSTGSFSLLASLSGNFLSSSQYIELAKVALPLLFVSILSGVFVQHRVTMRPLDTLNSAAEVNRLAIQQKETSSPIRLSQRPTFAERIFYRIQLFSFTGAFVCLGAYTLLWKH